MKDPLPVPDQLEKQLSKCKTVRDADSYCKSREKTEEVSRTEGPIDKGRTWGGTVRAGGLTARRVPRLPSRTLSLRKIDGGEDGERLGGVGGERDPPTSAASPFLSVALPKMNATRDITPPP